MCSLDQCFALLFIRDCCPHGLAKRTVVAVVTTKHKNFGRTRVAIAVAVVLVVPALLNMLTNEVLRALSPGAGPGGGSACGRSKGEKET